MCFLLNLMYTKDISGKYAKLELIQHLYELLQNKVSKFEL